MCNWVSNMPLLPVRNKEKLSYVTGKTDIKSEHPVFRNFKQTVHYKVAIV